MKTGGVFTRKKGDYFDSAGCRLHFTDQSKGELAILLHGFVMNADLNWRRYGIIQRLASRFRVVALDLRGHGLSDKPTHPNAYGIELVEDVRRLLDHLGVERAHVIGFSTGGFVTLKFLTVYPDRLLSATGAGMAYRRVDADALARLNRIADALEHHSDFVPLMEEMDLSTRGLYTALQRWVLGRINDTKALSHVIRSFPELEVTPEALAVNTVPTLTLVGTKDPIAEGADAMHEMMTNHKLVWLEGGDKLSCLDMPEFCEALEQHLRESRIDPEGAAT